jgi:SAM-dependent methyltransferase
MAVTSRSIVAAPVDRSTEQTRPGYRDYVDDAAHMRTYSDYQERYAETPRESDKVLIELVREHVPDSGSLLDMGCSTGNFLLHVSRLLPGLELHGADMAGDVIAACRANERLSGIDFHEENMLDLKLDRSFDAVTVNAALMFFTPEELRRALAALGSIVSPGGHLIGFDYVQPFEAQVEIVETSRAFPSGLRFFFRSEQQVRDDLDAAGFADVTFQPFHVPINLPRPDDPGDIRSWTRRADDGTGLAFRGSLYQPWCHFVARKAS